MCHQNKHCTGQEDIRINEACVVDPQNLVSGRFDKFSKDNLDIK